MKGFLALSATSAAAGRFHRPSAPVLGLLTGDATGSATVHPHGDGSGWAVFAGASPDDLVPGPDGGFTVRIGRTSCTREADVPVSDLGPMIAAGGDLSALLPPFAAAHRARAGAPVLVAGDWLGLHQLYWWRGDGVAAVSTSARALVALATGREPVAALDPVGLGAQAMIGWQVGDATVFDGVRVLPPATVATLDHGSLRLRRYAERPDRPDRPPLLDDAVEEMAAILSGWQSRYLHDHPDAVLQLTGGHDSRILLAATPDGLRGGLDALTLGDPDSPDVVIAARLAARFGMTHHVHRFDRQRRPSPAEAHTTALAAARDLECQASPLALMPLLLAEARLPQGHRLAGLGGEVARGFYYAGQPGGAVTSPELVERLARWRLFSNEAVEPAALDPEFAARALETTRSRLHECFPAGDWLRATDEFYLYHRMHRWAGSHSTVAAVRRHYVNPMFDRRFVELALAVAPDDKRDSLLLGRLMTRLDPELARIPLDTGVTPRRLATRSAATRLVTGTLTARKMAGKVRQRVTHGRRAQLGAAGSAALVLEFWRAEPQVCKALFDIPVLRPEWLDGLLGGTREAQPTTVAFLVNLLAATGSES